MIKEDGETVFLPRTTGGDGGMVREIEGDFVQPIFFLPTRTSAVKVKHPSFCLWNQEGRAYLETNDVGGVGTEFFRQHVTSIFEL
jgi:hypothetical protein